MYFRRLTLRFNVVSGQVRQMTWTLESGGVGAFSVRSSWIKSNKSRVVVKSELKSGPDFVEC
jgi:hypothetical protein